jgi:hypothetical protein
MRKCPDDICSWTKIADSGCSAFMSTRPHRPTPRLPKARPCTNWGGGASMKSSTSPKTNRGAVWVWNGLKIREKAPQDLRANQGTGHLAWGVICLGSISYGQTRGMPHAHHTENRPRVGSSINWNGWEIGHSHDRRHAGSDQRRGHGCSPGSEGGVPRTSLRLAPRTSLWLVSSSWVLTFGLGRP